MGHTVFVKIINARPVAADITKNFSITLSNAAGEQVIVGFDAGANQYYIDRTKSGKTDFNKGFAGRHVAQH
jgi:fructan beta-fructosidase